MPTMTVNFQDIATRYEGAQCTRYGTPADWDVQSPGSWWELPKGQLPRSVAAMMAAALCEDCPLLSMCARDALIEEPVGVIRAGIPVTTGFKPARWNKAVWTAVASGGDLYRSLEGISPDWDTMAAQAYLDRHRPWTWGELARLPRRARIVGARPPRAGVRR